MTWAEVAFCDIDTRLLFTAVVKGFIIQAPAHPTHFKVLRLKLTKSAMASKIKTGQRDSARNRRKNK